MIRYLLYSVLFYYSVVSINAQQRIKFGLGNVKNVSVRSSSSDATGIRTLMSSGYLPNPNASSRFLSQATFGANATQINQVNQIGIEAWLDQQLDMPSVFSIKNYVGQLHQYMVDSLNARNPTGNYTLTNVSVNNNTFDIAWFQGSMMSGELLRWRVALALSEVFVTSRISNLFDNPYALGSYYDVLLKNSFGNYRSLIDSITYHPSMAVYLTFMNNHATDIADGKQVYPDENYAREIMQLFSIGLYELNVDGTERKDANGNSIPTYTNTDIAGLAKVFTGLSWGDARYLGEREKNIWSYTKRLKFFPMDSSDKYIRYWRSNPRIVNGHEPGTKTFLNNTIPNRTVQNGEQDIQDALNIIFNHPNVGPFIARRLIQRLVSSNPSADYIRRVATIFNNNGNGVRGDLKAVVKAILLDAEARDVSTDISVEHFGMLREPFMRYMNVVRGLNLTATGGVFRNIMYNIYLQTEQKPLYAPTVFNYFMPDYMPDGALKDASKFGPEFQLLSSQTLTGYYNVLNQWLIEDDPNDYINIFSGETSKTAQDPKFDLTADNILTKNNRLPELIDKYNHLLAHGRLSAETAETIRSAIVKLPYTEDANGVPDATNAFRRMRIALFLILSSPDYLINK